MKYKYVFLIIGLLALLTVPAFPVLGQSSVQAPYIGMWLSDVELAARPTEGPAWTALVSAANQSAGTPDISNQDSNNDVYILAKALVYARTGDSRYLSAVISNLKTAVNTENGGRTLALGRNLVSYVIAADLVNLPKTDPAFDATFRTWLASVRSETLDGRTLISTHEDRPNNWGTHAGASRIAIALYLNDRAELDRAAQVFRGWLGDRGAYAGFNYGELDWQCDPSAPVGVNPLGCTKNGVNIDGALPEEMRRGGGFTNPPTFTDYSWEAMQGVLVQATLLHRAGYDVFGWSDQAVLRAAEYLYRIGWQPDGDDRFQPWLLNYYYKTSYPTGIAGYGKNIGWTDWTHGVVVAPTPTTTATTVPTATAQPTAAPPTAEPTRAAPVTVCVILELDANRQVTAVHLCP